jgi:hypothetical protein
MQRTEIRRFITSTHTSGPVPYISHEKYCIIWKCLTNNNFFVGYGAWTRSKINGVFFVETHMRNEDRQKWMEQLMNSQVQKFVVSWVLTIFFLNYIFFNLTTCFYFLGKHITLNCRRDMRTILQPIRNLIQICGWRLDYLMDPIEIMFTISLTLQLRICKWAVVYRSLVPCNRVRANNLWLSRWLYDNKLKLRRSDLVLRWPNLDLRWPV